MSSPCKAGRQAGRVLMPDRAGTLVVGPEPLIRMTPRLPCSRFGLRFDDRERIMPFRAMRRWQDVQDRIPGSVMCLLRRAFRKRHAGRRASRFHRQSDSRSWESG
jgi:hypothetical protein